MSNIREHIKRMKVELDELSDKHSTEANEWLACEKVETDLKILETNINELIETFNQTKNTENE